MSSNPIISDIQTHPDKNELSFNIRNVDVSVINGLRRACQANIQTLVFRGFPHNESNINIIKNTTKFNNEYLKHRLQCIPIHNRDITAFDNIIKQSYISLNVKNTTMNKVFVTTNDFVFMDKKTRSEHKDSKEIISQLFPVDRFTGDGILILILMPQYNTNEEENEINIELEFDIGTAKENSCWNVVCKSVFENIQDVDLVNQKIAEFESNPDNSDLDKEDFKILNVQRFYKPNEYKFTIESIGIYDNAQIIDMACKYIIDKMSLLVQELNDVVVISEMDKVTQLKNESFYSLYLDNNNRGFFVLKVSDDDYTLGKLIENHLYYMFKESGLIEFVGFDKEHATKKEAFIYIKYTNFEDGKTMIRNHLGLVAKNVIETYSYIQREIYKK